MRLTTEQLDVIKEAARQAFGSEAELRLFGSRIDDESRGGDIDLWVDVPMTSEEATAAEGRFYSSLQKRLGEQRIDIVVHRRGAPNRPIDRAALEQGVRIL